MNDKRLSPEYQSKVGDFVGREVTYCVSSLVHTLANGYGSTEGEIGELCEKAFELSCPVEDWSGPVFEDVHSLTSDDVTRWLEGNGFIIHDPEAIEDLRKTMISHIADEGEQKYCDTNNLDPHQIEIYEHWIVSRHLANALDSMGEKVDFDFEGLVVWARTTSGQSISIDYVICKIYDVLELEIANL